MSRAAGKADRKESEVAARLTPTQKERVLAAAAQARMTPSEFVREAVLSKADAILAQDALAPFGQFIGLLHLEDLTGRKSKLHYADLLADKHAAERRRTAGTRKPEPNP